MPISPPPEFQTTKQDKMLELRDIKIEIAKKKMELEIIDRRRSEYDIWAKDTSQSAIDFLEDIKLELFVQFKELKNKDEELSDRKEELSKANSLHTNICDEIKDNQKVLNDINSKIGEAKIASDKAIKRAETDKDKTNSLLEENSDKRDIVKKKLEGLNQEVDIIRKEIEEGTEKVDKDLEYNKKWQAFLRSKERDLRL